MSRKPPPLVNTLPLLLLLHLVPRLCFHLLFLLLSLVWCFRGQMLGAWAVGEWLAPGFRTDTFWSRWKIHEQKTPSVKWATRADKSCPLPHMHDAHTIQSMNYTHPLCSYQSVFVKHTHTASQYTMRLFSACILSAVPAPSVALRGMHDSDWCSQQFMSLKEAYEKYMISHIGSFKSGAALVEKAIWNSWVGDPESWIIARLSFLWVFIKGFNCLPPVMTALAMRQWGYGLYAFVLFGEVTQSTSGVSTYHLI